MKFLGSLIGGFRKLALTNKLFIELIFAKHMQGVHAFASRVMAYRVYLKAVKHCPAYHKFTQQNNVQIMAFRDVSSISETNKENYVKKFSIEQRCYGGGIPVKGVVIDESSGSSGIPNNWVRGPDDRADIRKLLQLSYNLTYEGRNTFLLNCFALGPWATGMNVTMSLADTTITKSIGPDIIKLENSLKAFGTDYEYVIVGYPPFIKLFVNSTGLNLKDYRIHFITGGEAMSDGLRRYLSQFCISLISSYGASDLDINIGAETDFSLQLREVCSNYPELTQEIFGREQPPMIFQYNPIDYYIETSENGELIFTVNRINSAVPKVRYNLCDIGGTKTYDQLAELFIKHDLVDKLPSPALYLPILYVYGRGDLSVPFYGAKVFSTDLDSILHETPELAQNFNSFQLSAFEDDKLESRLKICLELNPEKKNSISQVKGLPINEFMFSELQRVNQEFREVSKMFDAQKIAIDIHEYETGAFEGRDIRIKQKYIRNN